MGSYSTENVGRRIRETRLAKGMTQMQLAGDCITRNMLSRIEGGAALPSLPTLLHIAVALDVSPAYLLSGGDDDAKYRKDTVLPVLREALRAGQYTECLALCRGLDPEDEEIRQISFCSLLKRADRERADFRLTAAAADYREALAIPEDKLYAAEPMRGYACFWLLLIENAVRDEVSDELLAANAPDDWKPFLTACQLIYGGSTADAFAIRRSGLVTDSAKLHFLDACLAMHAGDCLAAIPHLQAIVSAANQSFYLAYHALSRLEKCFETMENYRDAYATAKRRAALEEQFREK